MARIEIACARCGMMAYGIERAGKRKEYIDPRDIVCPRLFEAICPEWDRAVAKSWLIHDGLLDDGLAS